MVKVDRISVEALDTDALPSVAVVGYSLQFPWWTETLTHIPSGSRRD